MTPLEAYESTSDPFILDGVVEELFRHRGAATSVRERCGLSNDLAVALWTRYETTGDITDLDRALNELRDAQAALDSDDPIRLSVMANLSGALATKSQRTGGGAELVEALRFAREAAERTAPEDPQYASRRAQLGQVLLLFYARTGHSDALYEARRCLPHVIDAERSGSPGETSNLAENLRHVYNLTGDVSALEAAVGLARKAAALLPAQHVRYAVYQSNLSLALASQFLTTSDRGRAGETQIPPILAEALRASRAACAATPLGHPNEPERYAAYAQVLRLIHGAAPASGVLGERRRVTRTLVAVTPIRHHMRATALMERAMADAHRALQTREDSAVAAALDGLGALAFDDELPVVERIAAAHQLANFACVLRGAHSVEMLDRALAASRLAVELLPRAAGREFVTADRERRLGHFTEVARDAAACALAAGQPELALALLEQGRGVLLAQVLETWPEPMELSASDPDLAAKFERLRTTPEPAHPDPLVAAEQRAELAHRWAQLFERTRATSAFAGFLRPPTGAELSSASAQGALAVINISGLRCDALLVVHGRLHVLPLPDLHLAEVEEQAARFSAAVHAVADTRHSLAGEAADERGVRDIVLNQGPAADERAVRDVLLWLWRSVVEPVLAALRYMPKPPRDVLPRLWWIPTGELARLPLHAAGDLTGDAATALDRVVSSYAPTIRALQRSRARPAPGGRPRRPLVIAVPDAAGLPALPAAAAEGRVVAGLHQASRLLLGAEATRSAVLDALSHHDWVHFAGHARSLPADPGASHLVAYDGHVTVRDLSRHRLAGADLAFLSACDTTRSSARLMEEAIHLTGACYLAGFRQVIGTLWRIQDDIAERIATNVHAALANNADGSRGAAHAVHLAVRQIRAEYPDVPTLWAAHVHVGG